MDRLTASLKEQTDVRHKHDYFSWTSPELLSHFKLRWDDLIKEAKRVGIDAELSDKNRFYHFAIALVKYGHSDLVRRESAQRAAHIDVNTEYDIEDHYQTCIRHARVDTDASKAGTPNLREPDTALAATIGQQLKNPGRSGKGYVSDDSSADSGSTTGSSASSGNSNTVTQAYIERQKKATKKKRRKSRPASNVINAARKTTSHPIAGAEAKKNANSLESDPRTRETKPDPSSPPVSITTMPTTRIKSDSL